MRIRAYSNFNVVNQIDSNTRSVLTSILQETATPCRLCAEYGPTDRLISKFFTTWFFITPREEIWRLFGIDRWYERISCSCTHQWPASTSFSHFQLCRTFYRLSAFGFWSCVTSGREIWIFAGQWRNCDDCVPFQCCTVLDPAMMRCSVRKQPKFKNHHFVTTRPAAKVGGARREGGIALWHYLGHVIER